MKSFLLFAVAVILLGACTKTGDTTDGSDSSITNDPVVVFIGGTSQTIATKMAYKDVNFGDQGYSFLLAPEVVKCGGSPTGPRVRFFVKGDLKVGQIDGMGPYVWHDNISSSYMGCNVEIISVSATEVTLKVFGGSKTDGNYVEGKFTASICQ